MPRTRVRGARTASASGQEEKARDLLQTLAKDEAAILRKIAELQESLVELQTSGAAAMEALGVSIYETQYGTHKYAPPGSRATHTIDVEKLYGLLDRQAFFNSVKAIKKDASKHLSEKELEKITTTTQPAPKPPVYSFDLKK